MISTTKSPCGTSFFGHTISTTVNKLKKILGQGEDNNNGSDKVNFDWTAETDNGDVFTVYDWKYYRPLDLDEIVDFHIGAKTKEVAEQAKKELLVHLEFVEPRPIDNDRQNRLKADIVDLLLGYEKETGSKVISGQIIVDRHGSLDIEFVYS